MKRQSSTSFLIWGAREINVDAIRDEVKRIYSELGKLGLESLRLRRAPPKGA